MKTLLHQTDRRLSQWNNDGGCSFMTLLAIPQLESLRFLSPSEINEIERVSKANKWLARREKTPEGWYFLEKPDDILAHVWKYCGCKGVPPKQIGSTFPDGKPGWGKVAGARFTSLKGNTSTGNHFRLGNVVGREIYDPMPFVAILSENRVDYYG